MSKQLDYLNGLKGICAISVSIFHFLLAFAPFGYIGYCSGIEPENFTSYYFSYFPYSILSNASFPLYIFFALIGFIPAYHYFKNNDLEWIKRQAIIRYFRFMPPVLICCVLVYIGRQFNLFYSQELGTLLNNPFNLDVYNAPLSLASALYNGLFGVLFEGHARFNSVFWCMFIIMTGSYITYGIIIFFGDLPRRYLLYIAFFGLCFYSPIYTAFLAGIIMADYLCQGDFLFSKKDESKEIEMTKKIEMTEEEINRKKEKRAILALILGCVCGFFPEVFFAWSGLTYIFYGIGAFFVIYAIGISQKMQKFLSCPFLLISGKYSFSLIIAHFPLMYTLPALTFIKVYGDKHYLLAIIASFIVYLVVSVIGTFIFHHLVGKLPSLLSKKALEILK